ncbi:uncharacterized protein LOC118431114 [Branchiostoma floridae]|uniref:Uncharacterized protein LOC118431114 n=1 Tax=Branchiostoma floridae TaxID=7739 RepID=A0A9J7MC04_BRAFL|nr:uncharacterized protein LOC118431114 [Branchiostoma floridae]
MPKDSATNTFLANLAPLEAGRWLGLTDNNNDGQWQFEDGQILASSDYSNWPPGEPAPDNGQGGCVGFWGSGSSWDEKDCSYDRGFICQLNEAPKKWRKDWRCGWGHPAANGNPAECYPAGVNHCCSFANWCGNTAAHCDCRTCVDYRITGPCVPGSFSRTGTDPCDLCPVGTFQAGHGQTECLSCPLGTGTDARGSETSSDCVDINECTGNHGCDHVCRNTQGSYRCECHGAFTLDTDGRSCSGGWPRGTYGLPRTNTGCPESAGVTWHTGSRFQDTEDDDANNYWTSGLHFDGDFWRDNMIQKFCMKTSYWTGHGTWPRGSYCIFKKNECPSGFQTGEIYWDDEDNPFNQRNSRSGSLPDGKYDRNTLIWYCCRNDGSANTRIPLPSRKPFYLFRFRQGCQKVLGMNVREEYFRWDDEDTINESDRHGAHPHDTGGSRNHKLHYCYYS